MKWDKRRQRGENFVVCPRCGLKSLSSQETCPDCGLVFSRLAIATNKDAKRKIWRHDRDFIIMSNKLPNDVSRTKLLLMTILTGFFGGHCFYIGRYWRGALLLLNAIMLIMCGVFNSAIVAINNGSLITILGTLGGLIMLIWIADIIWVATRRFKVPIAIDLQSESLEDSDIHDYIKEIDEIDNKQGEKEEIKINEDSSRD